MHAYRDSVICIKWWCFGAHGNIIGRVELDLKRSGVGVPYNPKATSELGSDGLGLIVAVKIGVGLGLLPPSYPATHHPGVLDLVQHVPAVAGPQLHRPQGPAAGNTCCASPIA